MTRDFNTLLAAKWDEGKFLCVGLDPDVEKIPVSMKKESVVETLVAFNRFILEETHDIVSSYKPNSAFYERYGAQGIQALQSTIELAHSIAPGVPIILDAKRADIGNTNNGYTAFAFDHLQADALTVHPYMGGESLKEFFAYKDKGIFVMCRNSNPGAGEFQDLEIAGMPLYIHVARSFRDKWNTNGNCGLVVGATYPEEIERVRSEVPNITLLIPGTGAQGGDLQKSVRYGKDAREKGFIISTSRAIIFADSPRAKAQEFDSAIRKALVE
ncbi:MAG: orotidine-5'-phosphate decarboxylase [Patescibacteria group bacterium]